MEVIRAQNEVAGLEAGFGDGLDLGGDIVPRRAQPEHGAHALAHPGDGIFRAGSFVIVGRASGGIGMEGQSEIGRGIVSADRLAGPLRGGDLGQHLGIACDHAREVHHFAKADDVGPGHGLRDLVGAEFGAGRLESRRARHAARHLHEDIDRQSRRLVVHEAHARQAQNIGDLVRVDEHRGRAMRDHGAGEFGHRHHAAFDVHVAVAEARHQVAAIGRDHHRIPADAVGGIGADIGEAPVRDGDVGVVDDLAGMHVHPAALADHHVGGDAAHGGIDQAAAALGPALQGSHGMLRQSPIIEEGRRRAISRSGRPWPRGARLRSPP